LSRVLVVDDDTGMLRLVEYALRNAGHEAITTPHPEDAVELARKHDVDVIVLDVMMPGRSGFEVLAELRGNPQVAKVPVLMLSALSEGPQRVKGLREGADDYMIKPLEPEELVLRLDRLLARAADASADLQGRLGFVSVSDVMQTLLQGGKEGVLEVVSPEDRGRVVLDHGQAMEASLGELDGRNAILAMLTLERGHFRFYHATGDGAAADTSPASAIPLQELLFTGAWLDDELTRRPDLNAAELLWPVASDGGPPPTPEGFESLPLFTVWKVILDTPGLTLGDLLARDIAAPRMVRLAVSVLVENGALRTSLVVPALATVADLDGGLPLSEGVNLAVEAARGSGFPAHQVHLLVVVEPAVQASLLQYRQAVPASALAAAGDSLAAAWHAGRPASLPLRSGPGELVVHMVAYGVGPALGRLQRRLSRYAAVALWVQDAEVVPRLEWVVEEVETGEGGSWGVVVAEQDEAAAAAAALVDGTTRWRMHRGAPSGLAELLYAVSAAASTGG